MRLGPLLICLLMAAGTHAVVVAGVPYAMTEQAFSRLAARGLTPNELQVTGFRTAGQDVVPLSNADMLMARAMLDLSEGPQRLSVVVPKSAAYWSVSVFGFNTDVEYIDSDRIHRDPRNYVFATRGQMTNLGPNDTLVELSGARNYILIRVAPNDPSDRTQANSIEQEIATYQLAKLKI